VARWAGFAGRALRLLATVGVGFGGAWLAFLILGRADYALGPFDVEYYARPGLPGTEIALPPLGRLLVDSHTSPVRFTATLQAVDPDGVTEALRRDGVRGLVATVERTALEALRVHVWRLVAIGLVGSAVAALLVFRHRWQAALAAATGGMVLLVAAGGLAWATYRPSAFLEPTFTGSLRLAPGLVGPIRQATDRIEDFRAELSRITRSALGAYANVIAERRSTEGAIAILHVSDIHASPIGMDFAQRLATSFQVDAIIDTGDITSFGTPLEQAILSRIRGFDVPYVFVRGNHDPPAIGGLISGVGDAEVLEDDVVEVAGLTIYGAPHPLFTADPEATRDHGQIEAAVAEAGDRLAERLSSLPDPPDILAVHDGRMAQASAGLVPIVLSGHFHEFSEFEDRDTLFLRTGTTGGGGLDTFTADQSIPLAARILYFDGLPAELVAHDRIELDPRTGDLTLDRQLALDPVEPAPGPSPTPMPMP
jgi:predicted phosphodiesterase